MTEIAAEYRVNRTTEKAILGGLSVISDGETALIQQEKPDKNYAVLRLNKEQVEWLREVLR